MQQVFQRLEQFGLHINLSKCQFFQDSVVLFGAPNNLGRSTAKTSHIMKLCYGFLARRNNDLARNHSLQARRRRNARRKATFMMFATLLQVALSFLFRRRASSVWMFVR